MGIPGRYLILFAVCLLCAFLVLESAQAQTNNCGLAAVDVNVVLPDGRLVRGLHRESLMAAVKHDTLKIDSLSYDTGPRRILFVLDSGRDLPSDALKAESEVASYIVSRAPAESSFALITARGGSTEVPFGESREHLVAALSRLPESANGRPDQLGALDAVMQGVRWFDKALPGDAIVLMVSEIGDNRDTKYSTVADALAQHHIRLFSFSLGTVILGTVYSSIDSAYATGHPRGYSMSSSFAPNEENLSALTWNSGGYMVVENTEHPWKQYKLTDSHLEELRRQGGKCTVPWRSFIA